MNRIAIVGMACRYPDAASPQELWEIAVDGPRASRWLPDVRMGHWDCISSDPALPDPFYAHDAAALEGFASNRTPHTPATTAYRSPDSAFWLARDALGRAFLDADLPAGEALARKTISVVIGSTHNGEPSRANEVRHPWPYARRLVVGALEEMGWDNVRIAEFTARLEAHYHRRFPPTGQDTVASGLSNAVAGRICSYYNFNGGDYSVGEACSPSLIPVTTAGSVLLSGVADVVVAGGINLSIDPLEIIEFARAGALVKNEMRLYDRYSNGLWRGEGCGMVVLMREEDAIAAGNRIYASIAGWGISYDDQGDITRPEVSGHHRTLQHAYEQAGFGIETVPLFEVDGTGTSVGDSTELTALSQSRAAAGAHTPSAAISSIKGTIGHTKAAAGIAGLIKAAMALDAQILPPAMGFTNPGELLTGKRANLRALHGAEAWPAKAPLRAGVSAMGLGGIKTHVVLEKTEPR